MKRIGVGLAAVAILAVSGCGAMHPGAAVVVDGESVSMEKVDGLAGNLCEAVAASGQAQDAGGADARQQAASMMLTLTAVRQAADDLGVEAEPSDYAITEQDTEMLESQFADADIDQIKKLIEIGKETTALVTAIGEDQSGESGQQAQEAGQKYLQDYIASADVDVDPRYGLDDKNQPQDVETLSARVSDAPEDLPATQKCT